MFQGFPMSPPCFNISTPWCVYASFPYATYHILFATLVTSHGQISQVVLPPHHPCEVYRCTHNVTAIGCPSTHSAAPCTLLPSLHHAIPVIHPPWVLIMALMHYFYYACPTPFHSRAHHKSNLLHRSLYKMTPNCPLSNISVS